MLTHVQDATSIDEEVPALLRQFGTVRHPSEQVFSKPAFQLLNLRAQRRLGKVQPQCGLPKMTLFRDRDEGNEMTKLRTVLHRRTAP